MAGQIELFTGENLEDAVSDLDLWEYIWVLFHFHRSVGWRPRVLPPRSEKKRGVLATRAPHRPSPIGLSVVRLDRVDGLTLHVRDLDILDGTPVLDIKPYVAWADAIPTARAGWLERPSDPGPVWDVRVSELASEQLAMLTAHGVDLLPRIETTLSAGPTPHAYRRIRRKGDAHELSVKAFRVEFRVEGQSISVERVRSGYRARELALGDTEEHALHRELVRRFG